ncbi:MAG: HAMP domain-containing histidine kinase [Sphingomonadales bacterium]|nr:HAMP domain-containing histidine kinase [Sphingomonadales bacterium]
MQIWIIFAVITLIVTTGTQWLVLLIKPGQDELYEKWQTFDRRIAILNELLLMATIFCCFPFLHMEQRIFATAYVVGYIPMTIFADPGNVTMNRIATVLALGSFAVFLVIYGNGVEQVLALVVVAYGCFLFYAVGNIHRIITKSVAAQWEAERLSKELQLALIETAAERDAKTRFISTASHDLGQPLQAAKLFSEQVAEAHNQVALQRARSGLDWAITSAQQMLSHMLNHMRLEADAVTPYPKAFDLSEVIQRIGHQYSALASQHDIHIKTMSAKGTIFTDIVLLERAIGNLVHNAILHSGGHRILIGGRKKGGAWNIWVIDNGVGVEEKDAASIFDEYTQASNSKSQVKVGFGLGLSSVKRLAKLLGGGALLDPRWTNGAAFCIAWSARGGD